MPCKVCDHTLHRLTGGPWGWLWCPRCGTLYREQGVPLYEAPMLVSRVKRLIARMDNPLLDTSLFEDVTLPLRESVGLPLRKDSPCSLNSSMPPPSELAAG